MSDQFNAWVYMLRCSDGSYYVGSHRGENVLRRVSEHQAGIGGDYTCRRRPVELVWSATFYWITDAIACERQIKAWSRAKKEALIGQDFEAISKLAKRRAGRPKLTAATLNPPHPEAPAQRASKDAPPQRTN